MKTKTTVPAPVRPCCRFPQTGLFLFLLALLMQAHTLSAAVVDIGTPCFFKTDEHTYVQVNVNGQWWGYSHAPANGYGITFYPDYRLEVYDHNGLFVGNFAPMAAANPMYFDLGNTAGFTPPFHITWHQNDIAVNGGNVIATHSSETKTAYPCNSNPVSEPGPDELSVTCFSNDPNSIYSDIHFSVPPTFYLYCSGQNLTPVLYCYDTGGNLVTSATPATFNTATLSFSVFPHLGEEACYFLILKLRNNNTGVETDYWVSFNNNGGQEKICVCPRCDASFRVISFYQGHSGYISFITLGGNIAYEVYTISNAGGFYLETDGSQSIELPFGIYTVCHVVTTVDGQKCRVCREVEFDGEGNGGPAGIVLGNGSVSPNPASDEVTVRFELLNAADITFTLSDMYGKTLQTFAQTYSRAGTCMYTFHVSSFTDGIYTLLLRNGMETKSFKLVVKH